ncbi:serine hydrolase domain-containing protein [Nocardioides sp. WV_118_6]
MSLRDAAGTLCGLDVPALMREAQVPGCSVAILDQGRIVERRAFGVRSSGEPSAVTAQTVFQACSISKLVSLVAVLRLVDRGDLALDEDVNGRLRQWHVPADGRGRPRVTLRQLATHTAGLSTSGFLGYAAGTPVPSLLQVLDGTAPANSPAVRREHPVGTEFLYSGGGTTVIQLLVEELTGLGAERLLDELVLSPLGMRDSTFAQPLPEAWSHRAAHGHRADGSEVDGAWHTYPEQLAAGLWSTPSDLLEVALSVQRSLSAAGEGLLTRERAAEMVRPEVALPAGAEVTGGLNAIGVGTFLRVQDESATWFGHTGVNEGYRCCLLASTATGQGAVVMTNSDAGFEVIEPLLGAIATSYGWDGLDLARRPAPRG